MPVLNHMSGKDVQLTFRQNNAPVVVNTMSIDIEEVAEEVADQVNGEDRARLQLIPDFYIVTFKAYTPSLELIDANIADIANIDARVEPLKKVIGVRFRKHDGTRAAYTLQEVTRSPFQISVGGRKERVMQSAKYRARYWKSVQAA